MKRWWTALFALMMMLVLPAAWAEEPEIPAEILMNIQEWYADVEIGRAHV